jgi:hypothetical protein
MIPDQGSLKETAPAKLLLALYEQSQTGILYFRQSEILKVFYLNRGKISWAISSDDEDRLEHVLLAKKLVNPEALAPYQNNNKITESFGKVLVENGVLTLEGLITATREQVRHIVNSIMRWTGGSYQLALESPPTRLVSLDLDIPSLVAQYILTQMDVNIVWEELGSLAGELQQNLEPGKKNLYPLDAEQQEVFSRFREPQRLEAVLLDFPAERKHRILKILYFFLMTGLVSRREAEKMPSLDFKELDSLFGQAPPNAPAEVNIEMPSMIDEAAIKDIPLAELPEISVTNEDEEEHALPELPDLIPPDIPESKEEMEEVPAGRKEETERPRAQPFLKPEKQRPRWLSVTFLSILLAAVLIGAILWLTRSSQEPSTQTATPPAGSRARAKQQAAKATPTQTQGEMPSAAETAEPHPAGKDTAEKTEPPEEKLPAGAPLSGTSAAKAASSAARPASPGAEPEPRLDPAAGSSARQYFSAGNFRSAGAIWRNEMLAAQVKYSILLEMDCLKQSVRSAYRQVEDKDAFFLLNKVSRDGRSCWLVLWGRFRTADEATLGLKLVPEYFFKQSNPPSVIELEPYL